MYTSSAPEAGDDVAQIMELVASDLAEEELEEREVIVLKDIDEELATRMVAELGRLSEQEIRLGGGQSSLPLLT